MGSLYMYYGCNIVVCLLNYDVVLDLHVLLVVVVHILVSIDLMNRHNLSHIMHHIKKPLKLCFCNYLYSTCIRFLFITFFLYKIVVFRAE
jgi:hypothetical protein